MCKKCEEMESKENNEVQIYTLYFYDGKRIVLKGKSFGEGWDGAQAASEVVLHARDIEWMDRGETDTHQWIPEVNSWLCRLAQQNERKASVVAFAKEYPSLRQYRIVKPVSLQSVPEKD